MLARLFSVLVCTVLTSTAFAGKTFDAVDTPLQNYWSTFGRGDPTLDVRAVLDKGHEVVAEFQAPAGDGIVDSYALFWDRETQSFDLLWNGEYVMDLVTGEDEAFRPNFSGLLDDRGEPLVRGFVDSDGHGNVIVQITPPNGNTVRLTAVRGHVVAMATCVCFGTGPAGTDCSDSDCDTSEDCVAAGGTAGSRHCRWRAGDQAVR